MKLLFVHDIKAKRFGGKVYARSYGKEIWDRYLAVFDTIKVCTRSYEAQDQVRGIDLLTCDNVEFDTRIGMFKGPEVFFNNRIRSILRENIIEADAVILRLDSFLGLMTVRECKRIGKAYLIEVVGCAWDSFWNHGLDGKVLAPWLYLMMKKAIKRAPFVIYVTKLFLQNRYPTLGMNTNISNVSIPRHSDEILSARLTKISSLSEQAIINLYSVANVGVRYKGMHFVVKALSLLNNSGHKHYVYHMVGEGDQTYIRQIAAKYGVTSQIIFHGPLSHNNVMALLCEDADIYIQPSLQEGLPRAVIEAMSLGVPCITSDVAGTPELIDSSFMFDRRKSIPEQIAKLLLSMDKKTMLEQAQRNYLIAQDYEEDVLSKRRTSFLKCFARYIEQYKKTH